MHYGMMACPKATAVAPAVRSAAPAVPSAAAPPSGPSPAAGETVLIRVGGNIWEKNMSPFFLKMSP